MEAHAHVEVERVDGRDIVRRLHSEPPLTLRATIDGVHLVGSGAGPLGGDQLALGIRIGPGARLRLASVAAMIAQPGPFGDPSFLDTELDLERGGTLVVRPQPTILVQGCDHRSRLRARLASDATLAWREEVVLGRHGEQGGSLRSRLDVEVDDEPLLRSDVAVGERWPGSLGPSGVGAARAVGSMLLVGPALDLGAVVGVVERLAEQAAEPGRGRLAALALDGPAMLVSVVAERPGTLSSALDEVWTAASGAERATPTRW